MFFYFLLIFYCPLRISSQEVKANIRQKQPDFVPTGPPVEVISIEERNSETYKILRLLSSGYFSGEELKVKPGSKLLVRGRKYWYGKVNTTEMDSLKKICEYYVPPDKTIYRVISSEDGKVIRTVLFECDYKNEDCCGVECCSNVYTDCYIVLAFASTILLLALVFGVFVKFKDEITLLIFHLKVRKFKRSKLKELLKEEDANYVPADE